MIVVPQPERTFLMKETTRPPQRVGAEPARHLTEQTTRIPLTDCTVPTLQCTQTGRTPVIDPRSLQSNRGRGTAKGIIETTLTDTRSCGDDATWCLGDQDMERTRIVGEICALVSELRITV